MSRLWLRYPNTQYCPKSSVQWKTSTTNISKMFAAQQFWDDAITVDEPHEDVERKLDTNIETRLKMVFSSPAIAKVQLRVADLGGRAVRPLGRTNYITRFT
jgi:hypothetical protein